MENVKDNKRGRIEYFDLMKGVCIVLVIIGHCLDGSHTDLSNAHLWSMLEHLRMPLYFFLAGMFFKRYTCFLDFMVRKINKLVVPFLFFCFVSVIPLLICGEIECGFIPIKKHFTWMVKFGGYLWFLRTLFISNILYYIYVMIVERYNSSYVRVVVLLALVIAGWLCNSLLPADEEFRQNYAYLISIVSSFMILPFFYIASNIRMLLSKIERINNKNLVIIGVTSLIVCYFTSKGGVYLNFGIVENGVITFYVASLTAILCCWCLCFTLRRLPYFSYIGRYSIIAYLTHFPIIEAIVYKYPHINVYLLSVVILMLMPVMIWVFKTFFPAFVAQRDIFKYENKRVKVDWSVFSFKKR